MTDYSLDRSGDARTTLAQVVRDHGRAGIDDARLLSTLLPDLMPGSDRESALVLAAANGSVGALLTDRIGRGMPPDSAVRDVSSLLANRNAFEPRACEWVVAEYARALGYPISDRPVSPAPAMDPTTPVVGPAAAGGAAAGFAAGGFPGPTDPIRTEPVGPSSSPPGYQQYGGYPQSTPLQPPSPYPAAPQSGGGYPGVSPQTTSPYQPSMSPQTTPYAPAAGFPPAGGYQQPGGYAPGGYPPGGYPTTPVPAKRTGLIVGVVVLAVLLLGGGAYAVIKLAGSHKSDSQSTGNTNGNGSQDNSRNATGATCLIGNWKSDKLPTTLPGLDNVTVVSGSQTATFNSDGSGSQTITNMVVELTSDNVQVTVHGTVNYQYTATDSVITYTDVNGTLTFDADGVSQDQPETDLSPDPYTCGGDKLTLTSNGGEDFARQ